MTDLLTISIPGNHIWPGKSIQVHANHKLHIHTNNIYIHTTSYMIIEFLKYVEQYRHILHVHTNVLPEGNPDKSDIPGASAEVTSRHGPFPGHCLSPVIREITFLLLRDAVESVQVCSSYKLV